MTVKKNDHNLIYYKNIDKYKCMICGKCWDIDKAPVGQKCPGKPKKKKE